MTTQYHEDVAGREFRDGLLSITEFRAWLAISGKEIEMEPPLAEAGFIQAEALLCGIERAAQADYPEHAARAIVARHPVLSAHELAALVPQWLIGAERHALWRNELRAAIERGELVLRDPVTRQPIALPKRPESDPVAAASGVSQPHAAPVAAADAPAPSLAPRGITKQQVVTAFKGLYFVDDPSDPSSTSEKKWGKYLASPPSWLAACRTQRGTKSHKAPSLWDPVKIAVALTDTPRNVPMRKLDAVFVAHKFLTGWQSAWRDATEHFR